MAPLIALALKLLPFAGAVPEVARALGGEKAGAAAEKVVSIAKAVSGQADPDQAVEAVIADPALQLELQKTLSAERLEFARLAAKSAEAVNRTMRAEAAAEHWPTYSWRPAIGFAVALDLAGAVLVVLAAYVGVMFFGVNPEVLSYLPGLLGALAALVGVASPILGIASWFRGKMQADPSIPTINRG